MYYNRRRDSQKERKKNKNALQKWQQDSFFPFHRERRHFSVRIEGDRATPDVTDVKLLPRGLIVIADTSNCCVKLFNTQVIMIDLENFIHFRREINILPHSILI